ncbi:MAG: chemotaxis protein CheA [Gammaproteobacteria bacterium]|jgi:two-component system chemotaxis sensor kinase CheA|nr:chemotaxis protein CheA [Gammaproteobacteria bacterium]
MSIDLEQFHDIFFQESEEALDAMEQTLLAIDASGLDEEGINTIFRVAHSIKGGAATFGFSELTSFTHTMETLLDMVRSGKVRLSSGETDLLLRSVDAMRELLSAARSRQNPDPTRFTGIQSEFARRIAEANGDAPAPAADKVSAASSPAATSGRWIVRIAPRIDLLRKGNDPLCLINELAGLGESSVRVDAASVPPLADMDPQVCYMQWTVELQADVVRADIEQIFSWIGDEAEIAIEEPITQESSFEEETQRPADESTKQAAPAAAAPAAPAVPAPVAAAPAETPRPHSESTSIRVSIEKLDELINTVGELVITQSMLSQLAASIGDHRNDDLKNGLSQLERQMRALQESVMRVRMFPISFVFNRFPRMVRDLGARLGKHVELKMTGEQTELDKTVLEKIGDPLVHLVRNSIDHGIESPETRAANGKSDTGTIHLNAYHKGGNITVEIIDDGAGLNRERILAKARERGLIGPDEEPSDERVNNLIFHPGFSTAEEVSDVSGRGVGMDVVRRNIAELGGNVQVFSSLGKGSTVRIRLPLTLAILDGQLVRVGKEVYVIPLVSIVETIQMRRDQVSSIAGGAELFRLRDEYIPIIRLYDLFGIEPDSTELFRGLLTIVESDGRRAGILVDELLAQQQVVIKSLEANFRQLPGLSGATMLGDGHVALILDIPGLMASFESEGGRPGLSRSAA